ncbi:MAG: hypothetical protein ACRD5R_12475 [Candidatus Acidiferrales bacterium]
MRDALPFLPLFFLCAFLYFGVQTARAGRKLVDELNTILLPGKILSRYGLDPFLAWKKHEKAFPGRGEGRGQFRKAALQCILCWLATIVSSLLIPVLHR